MVVFLFGFFLFRSTRCSHTVLFYVLAVLPRGLPDLSLALGSLRDHHFNHAELAEEFVGVIL